MRALIAMLFMLLIIPTASAMQVGDNLYFSMKANSTQCFDLVLPYQAGVFTKERTSFLILNSAGSEFTDLTRQEVWTDENNTAVIPICFFSSYLEGRNCSEPFSIRVINEETMKEKAFIMGACLGKVKDFDRGSKTAKTSEEVKENLQGNFDLFDVGFIEETKHAKPGEDAVFDIYVQSHAELDLVLEIVTSLELEKKLYSVKTSPNETRKEIIIEAEAPGEGEYVITAKARVSGCSEQYCMRESNAILVVTEGNATLPRFEVSLTPKSLNLESIGDVWFTMLVKNNGEMEAFKRRIYLPIGLESTFTEGEFLVNSGESHLYNFTVFPSSKANSFYEMEVEVLLGSASRKASSYISVGEMSTDLESKAESLGNTREATKTLNKWYNTNSQYGQNLNEYKEIGESLEEIDTEEEPEKEEIQEEEPEAGFNYLYVVPVIVSVLVVVLLVMKSRKKQISEMDFVSDL